jgi:cyclophilin family peptidyl-prolyl cis-trans isomerase
MKPLTALAALLVLLQAPPRPPATAVAPRGVLEPLAVLNAERAWSGAGSFWPLINGENLDPRTREYAVRALGRVEDPQQVRPLMALQGIPASTLAAAIAQSLYGFDPARDPLLLSTVEQWMRASVAAGRTVDERMAATAAVAAPMSHIVYAEAGQVEGVETLLRALVDFTQSSPRFGGLYNEGIRALEALARLNTKLVHYDDKTIELLSRCARGVPANAQGNGGAAARRYGLMALTAARALDAESERTALADDSQDVRRVAMAVVAGGGGGLDEDTRLDAITRGFSDAAAQVRYEAVRAWSRHGAPAHGCQPLVDALKDDDAGVVIEATDRLGTLCLDNEDITTRLQAEATVPTTVGPWQPQAHAFVALAKRSPDRAAIAMEAFTSHSLWWVRMYSVFAAAGAKDVLRVERLAFDENDNVREAALHHLRAIDPERAERAILAALERTDVQLLRTAAIMVAELPANSRYVPPLVRALDRLTKTRRMTSRDGRTALLAAIERHAKPDDHTQLQPFLRDFDPVVAERAAEIASHLSGKAVKAEPAAPAHIPTQPFASLEQCVSIDMSRGPAIRLRMLPGVAPIAVEQFLKLATVDHYYNGLTFHRIVPNFVIQGGSPGANEYSGAADYMRDEIAGRNERGTVGLSTRGRNTADAQFFINLVDNPRLDGNYTVFARVESMDAVDRIQEGDVMRTMTMLPCR